MVFKIIWSSRAVKTYIDNIKYLEADWTEKEVIKFINATKRRILLLSANPNLGILTGKRKNVRKTVIHKRILLFYRIKPRNNEVELLLFWNTWKNPERLKR